MSGNAEVGGLMVLNGVAPITIQNCYTNITAVSKLYSYCDVAVNATGCFTVGELGNTNATSSSYIYNTLGWDKDVWEVTDGEYPRLKCFND